MTQGQKLLPDRLVEALVDAGTWMSRGELCAAFEDRSPVALEDALADLVIEGRADYRENVGYRLAGTAICRRAAQILRREGKRAAVLGMPGKDGYRVGVAEHRAAIGLVMYELAMPLPQDGQDALEVQLAQVDATLKFIDSRGGDHA